MKISAVASLIVIFSFFVLAAHASEEQWGKNANIDKFVYDGPQFIKNKSLSEMRKIGTLAREIIIKEANKHNPSQIDEFRTLQFDGLEIYGLVRVTGELSPIKITVTSSQWKILYDLAVGATTEHLTQVLGQPPKEEQDNKEYCGETECVNFRVQNGIITKVEFVYYAD